MPGPSNGFWNIGHWVICTEQNNHVVCRHRCRTPNAAIYWEHFSHQADIGVRGIGLTKEAAFESAVQSVTAVITDPESVAPTQSVPIVCEAPDDELLVVD